MRRGFAVFASVLAGTLGMLALPPAGARADSAITLPIASFHQIVADSAHDHLFISQGTGTDGSIVVTDFSGTVVATITGQDGVQGIALSPDGSTLYAALSSDSAVSAISTSTLTETARYSLGNSSYSPVSVAVQSGQVWVSYHTATPGDQPAIGAIDPAAANPSFVPQATPALGDSWIGGTPELAADPDDKGVLIAVQPGSSSTPGVSLDTTSVPATVNANVPQLGTGDSCEGVIDIAVAPGGAEFVTACGAPYEQVRYDAKTLSVLGAYPSTTYPVAVAIAAGAGTVAAGTGAVPGDPVYVYAPGGTSPLNLFHPGTSVELAERGLALSADGSRLFAVVQNTANHAYSLEAFTDPATTRSALTLRGPSSVVLPSGITLDGSLTLGNGAALPDGTTMSVTRTAPGKPTATLPPVQPGSNGSFTVPDNPAEAGTYTYTVSYAGDTGIAPATASFTVTVALNTSTLTLTGPSSAIVDSAITLDGGLTLGNGATLPDGTTMSVTRTAPGKPTATLPPVQPGSNGSFTVPDKLAEAGSYTYTVSYAGDADTAPATATFKVAVALNQATLLMSGPAVVMFGRNVAVKGVLLLATGTPAAGTQINVVRTESGSKATKTFPLTTKAGGGFTFTDPAPAKGHYTYTARYLGNAATTSAKAALAVTVARTTPALTLTTGAAKYVYGTRITVRATLGATFADRGVSIYARPAGEGWKLLKTGSVNGQGILAASYLLSRSTAFRAVFGGDVHNAPKTATRDVGVWVKLSMANSGYFKSTEINGVTYRVYHHTGHLNAAVAVTPNKHGQCVDLLVQQWGDGFWFFNSEFGCFKLNRSSKLATYLTLLKAAGARYRMRAEYMRSAADTTNLSTNGSWFYFKVVKLS